MRPKSNGGGGRRERERDSNPPLKETNGPMVHPHQQTPAATVDRDGKRNLVSGEKKKKVVNLGRLPRMPTPPQQTRGGG